MMATEKFYEAVSSFTSTSPDINGEGFNGYMEIRATFNVKDIEKFGKLYNGSYLYPTDKCEWYWKIRRENFSNVGE